MAVAERRTQRSGRVGGRPVVVLRMVDGTRAMIMHVGEQRGPVKNASNRTARAKAVPARSSSASLVHVSSAWLSLSLRSDRPTHPCHLQSLLMLIPAQLHSGVMRA